MLARLRAWYAGRSNPVKAAVATAITTFVTAAGPVAVGWANDVLEWVADHGALGAAAAASGLGLVNFAWRWVQAHTGLIPGSGPDYPTDAA